MDCVEVIWDTGATSPYDLDTDRVFAFKRATGSNHGIGIRWRHNGVVHDIASRFAVLLPDKSGVASTSLWTGQGTNWMDVVNADGTHRFRLFPPPLSERMDHTQAQLESARPGWPSSGIEFGVQAGYRDKLASATWGDGNSCVSIGVLLAIDWSTGDLKDWKAIPPGA